MDYLDGELEREEHLKRSDMLWNEAGTIRRKRRTFLEHQVIVAATEAACLMAAALCLMASYPAGAGGGFSGDDTLRLKPLRALLEGGTRRVSRPPSVCYGPGVTRRTRPGRGRTGETGTGTIIVAMPAQALHAIEQTRLRIRGTEFHWLRLAGCGSIKASPAARQQPPPHSAFV